MNHFAFPLLLVLIPVVCGFYFPGATPNEYVTGDNITLSVNKLTSVKSQLPLEYYTVFPFCRPSSLEKENENLGELLRGDVIESSNYKLPVLREKACTVACYCDKDCMTSAVVADLKNKIDNEYRITWIVDNLDAVRKTGVDDQYEVGFPIGEIGKDGVYYINNQVNIEIWYNNEEVNIKNRSRIIRFLVDPRSTDYKENCTISPSLHLKVEANKAIYFTYRVNWVSVTLSWSERWDIYFMVKDSQIHWFSIINSMMIVLFLTGMVAMIMMRTLHQDFRRYNQVDSEEAQEDTGWKLVHGDVFRPPTNALLFSVLVGTGVQVLSMTVVTMVFAVLGFLSPANRGSLLTALLVFFVLMGIFAGYFSARTYKMCKGQAWKKCTLMVAFMFPGIVFGTLFLLNFFLWGAGSSAALPFGSMVALIALWFGISVPLAFLGSYFGFKKRALEQPVRTNQIPRQIPEQAWYMRPIFSIFMGGILPFGAVFIELFFILSSIWQHQIYYLFGFLFIVFIILIATCAEITIVMCYFQLCSEDYHWWWRSYLTPGSAAVYMFLYSAFYFFTKLQVSYFISGLLYFGYIFILSFAFFVLTGTIGFYACLFFVRKIYSFIKVD